MLGVFSTNRLEAKMCSSIHEEPVSIALRYGKLINTFRPFMASTASHAEKSKAEKQKSLEIHTLLKETFFPMVTKLKSAVSKVDENLIQVRLQNASRKNPTRSSNFTLKEIEVDDHAYPMFVALPESAKSLENARPAINYNVREGYKSYQFYDNNDLEATSQFLSVMPSAKNISKLGLLHEQFGLIVTAQGEYGLKFSKDLIRTTEILTEILTTDPKILKFSADAFEENFQLITNETGRGRALRNEAGIGSLVPVSAFVEGILSFHQLVNTLLAKKIQGLDSGEKALHDLIFNGADQKLGLIAEATSRFPIGVIGPMAHAGLHFKKALELNSDGRLQLSAEIKSALREFAVKKGLKKSRCPMASLWNKIRPGTSALTEAPEKAGLQELAEIYWNVFAMVSKFDHD